MLGILVIVILVGVVAGPLWIVMERIHHREGWRIWLASSCYWTRRLVCGGRGGRLHFVQSLHNDVR